MKCKAGGAELMYNESHPVRGAWIEMAISTRRAMIKAVAPREGCVD